MSTLVITRLASSTTIDRTPTPIVVSRQLAGTMGATGPAGPPGLQPVFTRTGSLDTATGTTRLYMEADATVARVRAAVGTPPQGQAVIVALMRNGAELARATVAAGANTGSTDPDAALVAGDYLTVNLVQVGTTEPGRDLTVTATIEGGTP